MIPFALALVVMGGFGLWPRFARHRRARLDRARVYRERNALTMNATQAEIDELRALEERFTLPAHEEEGL